MSNASSPTAPTHDYSPDTCYAKLGMSDELLIRLFQRHFADPVAALFRLDAHLASIRLPFDDFRAQLRELTHPPQPGLPDGIPSLIYYFLPGTRKGTDQPIPHDPIAPAFVNACDGIGLNLGCPVRLLRALDALARLNLDDQAAPRDGLRNARQHFATVEELLWLSGWKSLSSPRRGGRFNGMNGDMDWAFEARGFPIFLEAKFRLSDWPRLSDRGGFVKMGDGFLSKAVHKFPDPPQMAALHIVGITTFDNINEEIGHSIGRELETTPQIHAVIIRSLAQMTHILSLSIEVRDRVLELLAVPSIADFPVNVGIFFHRKQRDKRVAARENEGVPAGSSKAVWCSLQPKGVAPFPFPERGLYGLEIPSRGPDGEPHFQIVPKYPMASNDTANPPVPASP